MLHALGPSLRDLERVLGSIPFIVRVEAGANARAVARTRTIHVGAQLLIPGSLRRPPQHRSFVTGVLAHEVAHILAGDDRSTHPSEFAADAFAARVLGRLGLDPEPLFVFLFASRGSQTHPDGLPRATAFMNAYAQARWFSS